MTIHALHIPVITAEEEARATKIDDRLMNGRKVPQVDCDFIDWFERESDRLHGMRESLKQEGWGEYNDDSGSTRERAHGVEKVIYAHWHRSWMADRRTPLPETYAGHWLWALDQEDRQWDPVVWALLHERYPLKGAPQIPKGSSYWRSIEKPSKNRQPLRKLSG